MKTAGRILVCSSILALSAPVFAQARDTTVQPRDAATADALFRQGRQAMESKNYADACQKFAESQKLDPAAGTAMNLATCEEKLGKLASAWQHWKEAIDALPPKDDRITFARSRVDELEKRLPRLQITLASGGDHGAKVFRDDIEIGPGGQGVPLPVDPGPHTVTVRMPGHFPKSVTVSLAVGEQSQVDVHPGAVDTSAGASSTPTSNTSRTVGWVLGGVGIAGVGTAIASGLLLVSAKKTVADNCTADKVCSQQGLDAAENGKKLVIVNTAGWIVGGIGLGLGAYFVLSSPKSSTSAALTTRLGPDGASLSCVGSF
jgi:hypothetical protein